MTPTEQEDISNRSLRGFLSFEFIVLSVTLGIAWGTMKADLTDAQEKQEHLQAEITAIDLEHTADNKDINRELGSIKSEVVKVQTNQTNIQSQLNRQDAAINEMLKILREDKNGN